MKFRNNIRQRRIRLIFKLLLHSLVYCVFLSSVFFSIYILLPDFIAGLGLMNLKIISLFIVLALLAPLSFFLWKNPVTGFSFLESVISPPWSGREVVSALELEDGKYVPRPESELGRNLAEEYITRIKGALLLRGRYRKAVFPSAGTVAAFIAVIVFTGVLFIFQRALVGNLFLAMLSGLPSEFIVSGETVRFSRLDAVVVPPAYIDSDANSYVDLKTVREIQALQGARIKIHGTVDSIQNEDTRVVRMVSGDLLLSQKDGVDYFTISGESGLDFEIEFLVPMKGAFIFDIGMETGEGGTIQRKSKVFYIKTVEDSPPHININFPEEKHELVYGYSMEIGFSAGDDFGLMEIWLNHRDTASKGDYYRELVARFPKVPPKNYTSTYRWNPIMREGRKINELVYAPGTKMVEYFLEARDVN
ncbi:MAG: hypothetical protein JXA66_00820, partial [Oligoflexia bacterium]|nr:hypothetical protein [Oligoflexia bacterium]